MIDLVELERRIKAIHKCTPMQALQIIQDMKCELF
jgi:hypothetical protein